MQEMLPNTNGQISDLVHRHIKAEAASVSISTHTTLGSANQGLNFGIIYVAPQATQYLAYRI
jgi:hypothetical protein